MRRPSQRRAADLRTLCRTAGTAQASLAPRPRPRLGSALLCSALCALADPRMRGREGPIPRNRVCAIAVRTTNGLAHSRTRTL